MMGLGDIFFSILSWALMIALIIFLVRLITGGGRRHMMWKHWHDHMHGEDALEVLKTRYAKGEIDKKEFEEKKKDLMS